jgi:hypothetical protein
MNEITIRVEERAVYVYSAEQEAPIGELYKVVTVLKNKLIGRIAEDKRRIIEKTWFTDLASSEIREGKYVDVIRLSVKAWGVL